MSYAADVPKPTAFHDIDVEDFPVTFELWKTGADRTGPPTWQTTLSDPGAVDIPALGSGTWARVTLGSGVVQIGAPPGADPKDF